MLVFSIFFSSDVVFSLVLIQEHTVVRKSALLGRQMQMKFAYRKTILSLLVLAYCKISRGEYRHFSVLIFQSFSVVNVAKIICSHCLLEFTFTLGISRWNTCTHEGFWFWFLLVSSTSEGKFSI